MTEHTINRLIPSGFALAHPGVTDHPTNPTGRGGELPKMAIQAETAGAGRDAYLRRRAASLREGIQ